MRMRLCTSKIKRQIISVFILPALLFSSWESGPPKDRGPTVGGKSPEMPLLESRRTRTRRPPPSVHHGPRLHPPPHNPALPHTALEHPFVMVLQDKLLCWVRHWPGGRMVDKGGVTQLIPRGAPPVHIDELDINNCGSVVISNGKEK